MDIKGLNLGEILDPVREQLEPYKKRYRALGHKEQVGVVAGVFVVIVALVYFILLAPALNSREAARVEMTTKENVLAWMLSNENAMKSASGADDESIGSLGGKSLLSIVNGSVARYGISLKRYDPDGDTKLKAWFEKISFDKLINWLNELKMEFGEVVESISVHSESTDGTVTVKLVLESVGQG